MARKEGGEGGGLQCILYFLHSFSFHAIFALFEQSAHGTLHGARHAKYTRIAIAHSGLSRPPACRISSNDRYRLRRDFCGGVRYRHDNCTVLSAVPSERLDLKSPC